MFKFLKKKVRGEEIILKLTGMHCTSCAMNIDGALEDMEGVIEAKTSYAKQEVKVVVEPGKLDRKQLADVIKQAGDEVKE